MKMWKTLLAVGGIILTVMIMLTVWGLFFYLGLWIGAQIVG